MIADPEHGTETIGARLRRLRRERGLSQRALSSPGITYAYISRIEAGARQPSTKALRKLAPKLGVSVEYLETGSDLREPELRELRLADAELALRLGGGAEIEAELRQLLAEAETGGDRQSAAMAQLALGFAASERGDAAEAVSLLEPAVGSGWLTPLERPDAYLTLGRMYAAVGEAAKAARLFADCLDQVRAAAPENGVAELRFAAYLSFALGDLGELDRAQAILAELSEQVEESDDPLTRVRLYRSLGRLAALEEKSALALDYFRRAIALLRASDDSLHLARAHLSCAWTLNSVGRGDEAGSHLAAAERLFGLRPEPHDLAYLRTEQAKQALQIDRPEQALAFAREALALLGDNDPAERGAALVTLAEALVASGGPAAEALSAFEEGSRLLEEQRRWRECTQALRGWARLLRAEGREPEAFELLERASGLLE
ncbi:MAG TPA: helix-turn-helix domain-containing protein [Gaiellaceae bacterium]